MQHRADSVEITVASRFLPLDVEYSASAYPPHTIRLRFYTDRKTKANDSFPPAQSAMLKCFAVVSIQHQVSLQLHIFVLQPIIVRSSTLHYISCGAYSISF